MTGPDDAAPASPATAPPDRRALAVGAGVGAAAVAVELLTGAGGTAARAVAALGFGLVGGLTGWLAVDAATDWSRRRAAEGTVRALPSPRWAGPTVVLAPGWAVPTRPVPPAWTDGLHRQARLRYVAAGAAAVAGVVAALARLTPTRAAAADALVVGYPVVVGSVVATAAAAATYLRVGGWQAVFGAWSRRVVPGTEVPDNPDPQPGTGISQGSDFKPEDSRPVVLCDGPSPPPQPFNVKLPDPPDNV